MSRCNYVLITAAKNEEVFLAQTVQSVVRQTILPQRWVIVSDGSTDRTDQIASHFANRYGFITFVRTESSNRTFGNKVHAFRAGYSELHDTPYDFLGSLDADICLPADYYERLLSHCAFDAKLGLTGGVRMDLCGGKFLKVRFNELNFGAGYQFFRRDCYEDIGGYLPLEMGGEDTVAGIMARHYGWRVRAFPDIVVHHYRPTGTAQGTAIRFWFRNGKKCYLMGYHPLFEFAKLMQVRRPRDILHNLFELAGFISASLRGYDRQIPETIVDFLRAEQLGRLKQFISTFHDPASGAHERRAAG